MQIDPNRLLTLRALAMDVDGVLTDGTLTWSPNGEEFKTFSFSDIMGLSLLRRIGFKMALISGEPSPQVDLYARKMHIPFVAKGIRDKAAALRAFSEKFAVPLASICYFGDDINDLQAMEIAGLCACPSNAADEVAAFVYTHSGYVSTARGGQGAVRSLADAILAARNQRGRDVFQLQAPE
jgi:3-deoxy-D-manno-octulosonate 8-phosphate phosphatase (KDO 8-P phosphatase)